MSCCPNTRMTIIGLFDFSNGAMRKLAVIIIALGIALYGAIEKNVFQARGQDILNLFRLNDDFSVLRNAGSIAQPVVRPQPIVYESRELSTEYQPLLKTYAPHLVVPSAHASVIMDVDSGQMLYTHNADMKRQIASLTKLFTATIVMERVKDLNASVTIPADAVYADGTRIGCPRSGYCTGERLKVGEQVRAIDLLKAALMNSANDAAISLGEYLGGSQDGFARQMNERAKELGLENTHFCTPSGLEPDGRESECYSSAADVAKIAAHALDYDLLWELMRLDKQIITSVDGVYQHEIFNTDELLGQLPGLIGTKTGFTPLAGYSLLAVSWDASHQHRVVAVVLDDAYRWQSIRSMFDWSFAAHEWK